MTFKEFFYRKYILENTSLDVDKRLEYSKQSFGMSQFANNKIVIAGGFRDGTGSADVGEVRLKYFVYDHTQQGPNGNAIEVGSVVLNVDMNDPSKIMGLVNIDIKKKFKGQGYGRYIIDSIKSTILGPINIYDVKKGAVGFWDKMGATPNVSGRKTARRPKDWTLSP